MRVEAVHYRIILTLQSVRTCKRCLNTILLQSFFFLLSFPWLYSTRTHDITAMITFSQKMLGYDIGARCTVYTLISCKTHTKFTHERERERERERALSAREDNSK